MKINFKATNLELDPKLRNYIQEKMDMVEKFLGDIPVIQCDFEVDLITHRHNKGKIYRAEANLSVPGSLLRVEKTEKNIYKAVDKVKDHLARVIKKHKDKKIAKRR
ncbi:MAG: ribosome-associated translation inhibitor RaiA [bacterium]